MKAKSLTTRCLKSLRKENCRFKATLGYKVSPRAVWAIYRDLKKQNNKEERRHYGWFLLKAWTSNTSVCFLELLVFCWQLFNVPWLIQHLCLLAHMSPLCVHVDGRCYLCLLYKIISYIGWKLSLPQHDCISIPSVEIGFQIRAYYG